MVCVSQAFLLDVAIIPGGRRKVNGLCKGFTICLQEWEFAGFLFINRSKYIVILHIDTAAPPW